MQLSLNKPVTVKVQASPRSAGLKSAILEVDDPRTEGVDRQILNTVVVSAPLKHTFSASGKAQRNSTTSYFVTVPEGAKTLEIALGGLKATSQTRFIAIHPYGVPADPTSTINCYPNYTNPANTCRPDVRSYADRSRASGRSRSSRAAPRRCSTTRTRWTSPCSARPSPRRP
ncbi:hypothetical protein ACR6C2_16020 [Streptomyces sp. INA 01156]